MRHPSDYENDELISRRELAVVFLKMSERTFDYRRKELFANGLPKPDTRFRSQKFHVGSIRNWIANSNTNKQPNQPQHKSPSKSDAIIASFQ